LAVQDTPPNATQTMDFVTDLCFSRVLWAQFLVFELIHSNISIGQISSLLSKAK
jgi:hypothetical protein